MVETVPPLSAVSVETGGQRTFSVGLDCANGLLATAAFFFAAASAFWSSSSSRTEDILASTASTCDGLCSTREVILRASFVVPSTAGS